MVNLESEYKKRKQSRVASGLNKKPTSPFVIQAEDEEILDERWLLSYSDLMTLLFGFFVILYALSLEESHKFDSLVTSLAIKTKKAPVPPDPAKKLVESQALVEEQKLKIEAMEMQLSQAKEENKALKDQSDKTEVINELAKTRELVKMQQNQLEVAQNNLEKSKNENRLLKAQTSTGELKEKLAETQTLAQSQASDLNQLKDDLNSAKKENERLKRQLAESLKAAQQNEDKGQSGSPLFVTVMIHWDTKDHDVDLSIQTPSKFTYNFKKRKHSKLSGQFVLDTRRGPGAEIWRDQNIQPGEYVLDISLYRQYDNPEPAIVKGHISTPDGIYELPKMTLTPTKKRQQVRFRITKDKKLKLLP